MRERSGRRGRKPRRGSREVVASLGPGFEKHWTACTGWSLTQCYTFGLITQQTVSSFPCNSESDVEARFRALEGCSKPVSVKKELQRSQTKRMGSLLKGQKGTIFCEESPIFRSGKLVIFFYKSRQQSCVNGHT